VTKYKLAISGYVVVEVEADSEEAAKEAALNNTVAGELYNYEFDDIQEVSQDETNTK
jgi:hypothetical protein